VGKRTKDPGKVPLTSAPSAAPFNPAFGALAALKAEIGEASPPPPPPAAAPPAGTPALGAKVVLQRERKGHGGKTVTRVIGLSLSAAAMDELAVQLKRALGCGARVEAGEIVLQGDLTERAQRWFTERGVKKVVVA
jgi:translation initiation factor 1